MYAHVQKRPEPCDIVDFCCEELLQDTAESFGVGRPCLNRNIYISIYIYVLTMVRLAEVDIPRADFDGVVGNAGEAVGGRSTSPRPCMNDAISVTSSQLAVFPVFVRCFRRTRRQIPAVNPRTLDILKHDVAEYSLSFDVALPPCWRRRPCRCRCFRWTFLPTAVSHCSG